MFVALTTFPGVLTTGGYGLSQAEIGACYAPIGVAMLVCAAVGGAASDKAAATSPLVPSRRLYPALAGALVLPAGCALYGAAAQLQLPLGVVSSR